MNKTLPAALAGLALIGGALATTSPADATGTAARSHCVTRAQYKKAHHGMTKAKVDGLWHTHGHRMSIASSSGYAASVWSYNACGQFSTIAVSYEKRGHGAWKLTNKSAVWVG